MLNIWFTDSSYIARTGYLHTVPRLVLGDGFVISIGTEFIENEDEDVTKNDCEKRRSNSWLIK